MARAIDVFVGNRIRERRIEVGFDQMQLAGEIGVSADRLNDYETGLVRPDPEKLVQLALALDCPLSWLFGGKAQPGSGSGRPAVAAVPSASLSPSG